MNTAHMTQEDWNQYLNQSPTPAMEWIDNIIAATEAKHLDTMSAVVMLKQLDHKLSAAIIRANELDKIDQKRIQEGFKS